MHYVCVRRIVAFGEGLSLQHGAEKTRALK
jgi:hypothetical protein